MARDFQTNDTIGFGAGDDLEGIDEITSMGDVYLDNITADHSILSKDVGAANVFVLFFDDSAVIGTDRFTFAIHNTNNTIERADSAVMAANNWYRVLGRWKRNTLDGIYIKVLDYSTGIITKYTNSAPATTENFALDASPATLTIGMTSGGDRSMEGIIENCVVTDAVFTESQEDALMKTGNLLLMLSRPLYWMPTVNANPTAQNWGTNGTNGTVSGIIPKIDGSPSELLENYL